MNEPWVIFDYVKDSGINVIEEWIEDQPEKAQARIERTISYLMATDESKLPHVKPLTGYSKIFEVVISYDKVQYRPLGFYGKNRREFTLLIGAKEKNDRFDPKTAPYTALKRMAIILEDKDRKHVTKHE